MKNSFNFEKCGACLIGGERRFNISAYRFYNVVPTLYHLKACNEKLVFSDNNSLVYDCFYSDKAVALQYSDRAYICINV